MQIFRWWLFHLLGLLDSMIFPLDSSQRISSCLQRMQPLRSSTSIIDCDEDLLGGMGERMLEISIYIQKFGLLFIAGRSYVRIWSLPASRVFHGACFCQWTVCGSDVYHLWEWVFEKWMRQLADLTWCLADFVTLCPFINGIFPAISVNKAFTVISNCSSPRWASEPWGNSGRKEYLPSGSHQTASTPYGEPWGSSGCENIGYWPQIAEVHIREMISVIPESCIFPHEEKP